ncbi:MAG TPA: helix-turn-helix domain-containing protein [Streptosporangiaceae bacterium]
MSVGETLARARGQAGLTVAQVSQLTRIRETIISGIESDDYAACGGDFYARGHIRAIAQVVGADSEPLIREYDSARPEPDTIPPAEVFPPETEGRPPRRRWRTWATALGVVLLAAVGFIGYRGVTSSHHTPAAGPATGPPIGNSNSPPPGTSADAYAHKVVIRVAAIADCRVDFATPAGLFLLQANMMGGTSKTWTFYRAVDMTLSNPGGVRLTVDGKNPLPSGVGAQPVTLRLGLNRAVAVSSPTPVTSAAPLLRPVNATAFGPLGDGKGDNPQLASSAIDGSSATAWHTDWYATARFGGLKRGTGLLLDMGRTVTITSAQVILGNAVGADFQLRVGAAPALADLPPAARATSAAGLVRLQLANPARGRYVVIWFTKLPPDSKGTFQAGIYGIRLNGQP